MSYHIDEELEDSSLVEDISFITTTTQSENDEPTGSSSAQDSEGAQSTDPDSEDSIISEESDNDMKILCKLCMCLYMPRGMGAHATACARRQAEKRIENEHLLKMAKLTISDDSDQEQESSEDNDDYIPMWERRKPLPQNTVSSKGKAPALLQNKECGLHQGSIPLSETFTVLPQDEEPIQGLLGQHDSYPIQEGCSGSSSTAPRLGDYERDCIKTEYHPHTCRPSRVDNFQDYKERDLSESKPPTHGEDPWSPFETLSDFRFADLALDACMNKRQVNEMLDIINGGTEKRTDFNLQSHKHLCETWGHASELLTPFTEIRKESVYKEIKKSYSVWWRSIWEWSMDLVVDPQLSHLFEWDAKRLYKHNGHVFERFVYEPWTANRFWDVQSELPKTGKPLGYIIYADKTRLSSFGNQMGYPVFVKLANLPASVRNGRGYAGGRLIGWLPILDEDENRKKMGSDWVDFKKVVWHDSFRVFLDSIRQFSHDGCWVRCGDNIERHLFPFIYVLSADYEEQIIMALNRGFNGKAPCPVCLVPDSELKNFLKKWPQRDMSKVMAIVTNAGSNLRKTKADALKALKAQGLRGIDNAFWDVRFSSPYEALAFDHMHNYPHGLGGKHLWGQLKDYIEKLDPDAAKQINQQSATFPRWRGLNHFSKITDQTFQDAVKMQDIVKISPFVCHNVITKRTSAHMYILLCCIRSYLIVDAYMTMEVHTESTIAEGRAEMTTFGHQMEKYIAATKGKKKDWDIPKMHLHSHAFDDIMDKGSLSVFDSMFNEPLHGPLKDSYALRTNFKNIESQILKADHWAYVASYLRTMVTDAEDREKEQRAEAEFTGPTPISKNFFGNVILGSREKQCFIEELLNAQRANFRYDKFKEKLTSFLSQLQPDVSSLLTTIFNSTKITEFRYLKATYENLVTWRAAVDYLRCNPSFDKQPRYDCVLLERDDGPAFAQLVLVFTIKIQAVIYPIALVHPFVPHKPAPLLMKKDHDMCFYRVRKVDEKKTEFVWARSIVRGAVLVPAKDCKEDSYVVFDVLDSDIMLRMKGILRNT